MPVKSIFIVAEAEKPIDNQLALSVGQEHRLGNILAIRYGYKYKHDIKALGIISGINAGCGFVLKNLEVDYAYATYGKLGNTHKITLLIRL